MQIGKEWRKSTRSLNNPDCVEVRRDGNGEIEVRNSNRLNLAPIQFTPAEWEAFTAGAKLGEFEV